MTTAIDTWLDIDAVHATFCPSLRAPRGPCTCGVSAKREAARAEVAAMRDALRETREQAVMTVRIPPRDPAHHDRVKALGMEIGFGALMSCATRGWREVLGERGGPLGGEFVSGQCRATVESLIEQIDATLTPEARAALRREAT